MQCDGNSPATCRGERLRRAAAAAAAAGAMTTMMTQFTGAASHATAMDHRWQQSTASMHRPGSLAESPSRRWLCNPPNAIEYPKVNSSRAVRRLTTKLTARHRNPAPLRDPDRLLTRQCVKGLRSERVVSRCKAI